MSRIAYVNGRYVPHREAAVHVEDRGYQFADGVYEVCEVRGGRLIEEARHMARLRRSLAELAIAEPTTPAALGVVLREVVRRNRIVDGIVYLQVTRGVWRRDHAFPPAGVRPGVVVTARGFDRAVLARRAEAGVAVVTVPDTRWKRVDIKSVSLLPNVLAKQAARRAGAFEAWFVGEDGTVLEGASSNAWIVTRAGAIVTHPTDGAILRGITRTVVLAVAARLNLGLEERAFTLAEAHAAREAFLSSATTAVTPVVSIDGAPVGDGKPGAVARQLRERFEAAAEVSGPAGPRPWREKSDTW